VIAKATTRATAKAILNKKKQVRNRKSKKKENINYANDVKYTTNISTFILS